MAINGTGGLGSGNSTGATSGPSQSGDRILLGKDSFMKLLIAQLKNQNPLEPLKDTEFASQLAQLSSLESMQQLNESFQSLLKLQTLTEGSALLGRTITFEKPGDPPTQAAGKVDSIKVRDGSVLLMVGTPEVKVDQVRNIQA